MLAEHKKKSETSVSGFRFSLWNDAEGFRSFAYRLAVSSQIFTTTSLAFCSDGMGRNSCGP